MDIKYFAFSIISFLILSGVVSTPSNADIIICWECNPVVTRDVSYTWECYVGGQLIECTGLCDRTDFDICCDYDEGWWGGECDRYMNVIVFNNCEITDPLCQYAICPAILNTVIQAQCRTECDLCRD